MQMPDLKNIKNWTADDIAIDMFCGHTQCDDCAHYQGSGLCTAFPDKIPLDILFGEHDHRIPFNGDNGIVFTQKP